MANVPTSLAQFERVFGKKITEYITQRSVLDISGKCDTLEKVLALTSVLVANVEIPDWNGKLFLNNNKIGDVGATVLGAGLESNTSLTVLGLSENEIGDDGATALGDGLETNTTLTALGLTNNQIGGIGAAALGDGLKTNTTLTALDLANNQIGGDGAKAFGAVLKTNAALTWIDLSRNNIGDVGAAALGDGLKTNTTLTALGLYQNKIGGIGAVALSGGLRTNRTLTGLGVQSTKIADVGGTAVDDWLKTNPFLTLLNYFGNENEGSNAWAQVKAKVEKNAREPRNCTIAALRRKLDEFKSQFEKAKRDAAIEREHLEAMVAGEQRKAKEAKTAYEEEQNNNQALQTELETQQELLESVLNHWKLDRKGETALAKRCRDLLEVYLSEADATRRGDRELIKCRTENDRQLLLNKLTNEFCPSVPRPPSSADRNKSKLLVVAPGFGFLANPEQLRVIEVAGFAVVKCFAPNPEEDGFVMATSIELVLDAIKQHQPSALLCASKGGAYMVELWKRMTLGTLDKIPSLMINVHPHVWPTGLPKDVNIVLVQGSEEEVWPKARGYAPKTAKVQPNTLEQLIRTGSPGKCYLYYTVKQPHGVRPRVGDGHNPTSLLRYACLPRLVDALVSKYPTITFPASSSCFTSAQRQAYENMLGFDPRALLRYWVSTDKLGRDAQKRFEVPPSSEEYESVKGIFVSEPDVERFYCTRYFMADVNVTKIERIENGYLHPSMDAMYGVQRDLFEHFNVRGGTHTRWLFHGAGGEDIVQAIVEDPQTGFKPLLNERGLWGDGVYFARDAAYCWKLDGCCNKIRGRNTGDMMMILCLVVTGIPCVGESGLRNHPKLHPDPINKEKISYGSFVDCPSNPEMFVIQSGEKAYPAYIIHFNTP